MSWNLTNLCQFIVSRAGQRWNCFNSDKVAEISYASKMPLPFHSIDLF